MTIWVKDYLCNQGWSFLWFTKVNTISLLSPVWGQVRVSSVVSGESVDLGLDQNQSIFGVLVLSVLFQVLSHGDGLLDQTVKVFWDFWCATWVITRFYRFSSTFWGSCNLWGSWLVGFRGDLSKEYRFEMASILFWPFSRWVRWLRMESLLPTLGLFSWMVEWWKRYPSLFLYIAFVPCLDAYKIFRFLFN